MNHRMKLLLNTVTSENSKLGELDVKQQFQWWTIAILQLALLASAPLMLKLLSQLP